MSRLNVKLQDILGQISGLAEAAEVEAALNTPGWDPVGQGLLTMGASLCSTLKHLIKVSTSRDQVRTKAYAKFCMSYVLARMAFDPETTIPEDHIVTKAAADLLSFIEQFTPKFDNDVSLAESRLSIVCDHQTGALARLVKDHLQRLLRIPEEDKK